jgi:hypothetical protein
MHFSELAHVPAKWVSVRRQEHAPLNIFRIPLIRRVPRCGKRAKEIQEINGRAKASA